MTAACKSTGNALGKAGGQAQQAALGSGTQQVPGVQRTNGVAPVDGGHRSGAVADADARGDEGPEVIAVRPAAGDEQLAGGACEARRADAGLFASHGDDAGRGGAALEQIQDGGYVNLSGQHHGSSGN